MTDQETADAHAALAVSRRLVAVVSEACSGEVSLMIPALTGAIVVVAGGRGARQQDELLRITIESLELARGALGVSVRTIVLDGGPKS